MIFITIAGIISIIVLSYIFWINKDEIIDTFKDK